MNRKRKDPTSPHKAGAPDAKRKATGVQPGAAAKKAADVASGQARAAGSCCTLALESVLHSGDKTAHIQFIE